MDGTWIGKRVSLNCGPLGFYQGVVMSIQLDESTLTIAEVFQNGVSSSQPHVTLSSQDIKAIKVLKSSENEAPCFKIPKETNKASTDSSISKSVASLTGGKTPNRGSNRRRFVADNLLSRGSNSHPAIRRSRDEEAFGVNNGFDMNEEFDFEKNLALFDKRMIFSELDEKLRSSPKTNGNSDSTKYRNDENVLNSSPAVYRQIITKVAISEYVTDSGLIVPAISLENRHKIIQSLEGLKLSWDKIVELFARASTDILLQTLGASHRLNPSNSHQVPTAIVLCGRGRVGSFGLAIARLLISHGVKTLAYVPQSKSDHPQFNAELRLYKLFDHQMTSSTKDLPQEYSGIDIVINALESFDSHPDDRNQPWFKKALQWANTRVDPRTPLVVIDPPCPEQQLKGALKIPTKITIVPGLLPFSFHDKDSGKLYMVNIGIPEIIFKSAGIKFSSPYGAKSAIQLYRK
eukprot:TRINITY_DN5555_c0_g1_i1.p1 TRINITY_DN5555_c0_g1~~TRINITY_DN5555_c0_g1_i1.p1  ORF type:complete len:461 (-),score=127.11 TRINITY_DN5555_c0_g1_i1:223-1605(-)